MLNETFSVICKHCEVESITFLKDFVQHSFAALSAGLKSLEEG